MRSSLIGAVLILVACDPSKPPPDGPTPDSALVFDAPTADAAPDGGPSCPAFDATFCGVPASGTLSFCGQLIDAVDDQPIRAAGATGAACDPAHPTTTGPCAMTVAFYDGVSFATSSTPPPLNDPATNPVAVDDCGRFVIRAIQTPSSGFIAIVTDDGADAADLRFPTGGVQAVAATHAYLVTAASVTRATDAAWTASAGLAAPSLGARGAVLEIFRYHGQPVAGVTATRNGAAVPSTDAFYFTDASPSSRLTPVASGATATTGANGSVLLLHSNLVAHSGVDGAGIPATCKIASGLAVGVAGAYVVAPRAAVLTADTSQLCP
jgi:hypothetical protein